MAGTQNKEIENHYSLIGEGSLFYPIEKENLIRRFESIYAVLSAAEDEKAQESLDYSIEPGIFLSKKVTFITIDNINLSISNLRTDHTIFSRTKGQKLELIAQADGYLIVRDGVFSIFDPYKLSNNKIELFFIFIPIDYGITSLRENFFKRSFLLD